MSAEKPRRVASPSGTGGTAGWYAQGVTPTPGERYEFEDFVGARFTATIDSFSTVPMEGTDGRMGIGLRMEFFDHPPFETNLPVRFRDAR